MAKECGAAYDSTTWRERIIQAEGRGYFTDEDIRRAHSYATCAVGELVRGDLKAYLGFVEAALPDERAYEGIALSGRFTIAVEEHNVRRARQTLDAIEDRALQLKRELDLGAAPPSVGRAASVESGGDPQGAAAP